ncbi:MAG: FAD:protein FMN transferase [Oscillospiraceae bacterium]|nr:FAD:protein FMN transferase [Oscillospiraceae bacterium]
MKNLFNLKIIPLLISASLLAGCAAVKKEYSESFFAFDTFVSVTSPKLSDTDADSLKKLLSRLDMSFSSAYGADANTLNDEFLKDCALKAADFSSQYGDTVNLTIGAVTELWGISTDTPTVPDKTMLENAMLTLGGTDYNGGDFSVYPDGVKLDFGAAAKGYACDKAYELLKQTETKQLVLSMGSSTLLYGEKENGAKFKAAIKNPLAPSEYLGIIQTDAAFISTSGGYERYFEHNGVKYEHILSPETGYPVETDLVSVTVIIPCNTENGGIYSDMLSTAIYAEGTAGLEKYLENNSFQVIAADNKNNVYTSTGVDLTLYEGTGFTKKA